MKSPQKKTIIATIGTRPECIKMAPVIRSLMSAPWANLIVVSTGQHRELIEQTCKIFGVKVDIDLEVMIPNQTLSTLNSKILIGFEKVLKEKKPDLVLVQGDTTSVMAAAMASFYQRIPVGHVEAGLRTHDINSPFPEEFNRVVTGLVTDLHFAPTETARENLLKEDFDASGIHVTGNTVIDALHYVLENRAGCEFPKNNKNRLVLLTAHRRENFGEPMENICAAVRQLHDFYPDIEFVYPVHPNPNVREPVTRLLSNLSRVHLISPVGYSDLASLIDSSYFVLTDSGGLQEEAPALAKPVLVMRDETERPEAVDAGVAKLVGTNTDTIVAEARRLLDNSMAYKEMAKGSSPYGDGKAAERIAALCKSFLFNKA